ncbi:vesicle transport protein [Blastocladiella britannica]|nr:vesicle transport protein [Blastocladiella britannica]
MQPTDPAATRARVNLGRRMLKAEQQLRAAQPTDQELHQVAQNLNDIANTLSQLEKSTSNQTDSLLVGFSERLRSLHLLVSQHGRASMLPVPKYGLKAARIPTANHTDLLEQLRAQVHAQNKSSMANRRLLMNLAHSTAADNDSSDSVVEVGLDLRRRHGGGAQRDQQQDEQDQSNPDLAEQERVQAKLAEDLAAMAATLKANSLAFAEGLHTDAAVMDDAEAVLEANAQRMNRESTRLNKHRASSRTTTWWLVLVLIVVAMVSAGMFIVIKLFKK